MKFSAPIQAIVLAGILNNLPEGSACETCSVNQVNFVPGDNYATVTPRVTPPTAGTDGCLRMTASCDVRGIPNALAVMIFQDDISGYIEDTNLVNADLVCTNGSWVFTHFDVSTIITEVSCWLSGVDQSCGTCSPCDIVFIPEQGSGIIGSYWRNYTADSDGCLSLDAYCSTSPGGEVFMEFNSGIGGPISTNNEVTANLHCVNGSWVFAEFGVSTVINQIRCIGS